MLHHLKRYVAFSRRRIEPLIGRRVVRFQFHHCILAHSYTEIRFAALKSESIDRSSVHACEHRRFLVDRVGMYRNENIGMLTVGHVSTSLKSDKGVIAACHDDIDIVHV